MPPAATKKSKTSHSGDPLSSGTGGSPKVKISGVSAWRARIRTDFHYCKLSDGSKPHKGGTIRKGSSQVFIDGFPAARVGDIIIERSPAPNIILKGNEKVILS
jgi:uncharacterized Zn-binding protein involved in type VI secretion